MSITLSAFLFLGLKYCFKDCSSCLMIVVRISSFNVSFLLFFFYFVVYLLLHRMCYFHFCCNYAIELFVADGLITTLCILLFCLCFFGFI